MQREPLKRLLFAAILLALAAFFVMAGQHVRALPDGQTEDTGKPIEDQLTDQMHRFLADQEGPLGPAHPSAAAPCVGGMADIYPCSNVDLLAHIPLATMSATAGNTGWGWTDPLDGKEYAIMGLNNGTAFVDISDPVNPIYLGKLPTHTGSSSWREFKTAGNYVYIVSDSNGSHGMQVFDLTLLRNVVSPPVTFSASAHYAGQSGNVVGSAHNIATNADTNYAYIVGGSTGCSGGLHMVNIQNPLVPTFAGCFSADGYTHDLQCVVYQGPDVAHQGQEICFNSNTDTLTIVDVTIKNSPVMLSRTGYAGVGYTHQGWLTEDQRYFLLDDELDESNFGHNTRTYIWDLLDLDAPIMMGYYQGPTAAIDHNLYIRGNLAYESNYRAGLRILDISDVANGNLVEVAYFDTYPESNSAAFSGTWNNYPYFASGVVVISDINRGLFLVRPTLSSFDLSVAPTSLNVCQGEDALYTVTVTEAGSTAPVTLTAVGVPAGANHDFSVNPVIPTGNSAFSVTNTAAVSPGSYNINVVAANITDTLTATVNLEVSQGAPGSPMLTSPADGATGISNTPTFTWDPVNGAASYFLELANDINFTNIIYTASVNSASHTLPGANALAYNTWHYWRVTASNSCGSGNTSPQFSFRTTISPNVFCATTNLNIPDNNPTGVSHTITVPASGDILDVDIYVNTTHTWVGDLIFTVNHNAANATIINRPGHPASANGCSGNDIDVTVNDEGSDGNIETQCANAPAIFGDRVGGDPPNTSLLAVYDGMDINGDWTITVSDHAAQDTGTLVEWCVVPTLSTNVEVDLSPDQDGSGAPGSVVVYTLTITNTGNVSDTFDLEEDSQWVTLLSTSSLALDAGEVMTFTAEVLVPANANPGDTGISLVRATAQSDSNVSDEAFLTTTATAADYAMILSADPTTLSGEPGAVVTYTIHITNTGSLSDTYDLSAVAAWTTVLSEDSISLDANDTGTFTVTVTIPLTAMAGASDAALVTAVSQGDPSLSADVTLTTEVTDVSGVIASADPDALSGAPGAVVTYTVHITNTGNTTDTFTLSTADDNGWMSHLPETSITLGAGEGGMVMVMVHVADDAVDEEVNVTTVTAVSDNDPTVTAEVELTTMAIVTPPDSDYLIYLPIIMKP